MWTGGQISVVSTSSSLLWERITFSWKDGEMTLGFFASARCAADPTFPSPSESMLPVAVLINMKIPETKARACCLVHFHPSSARPTAPRMSVNTRSTAGEMFKGSKGCVQSWGWPHITIAAVTMLHSNAPRTADTSVRSSPGTGPESCGGA